MASTMMSSTLSDESGSLPSSQQDQPNHISPLSLEALKHKASHEINCLITDLHSADRLKRQLAFSMLLPIAKSFGVERCRSTFLPYIMECVLAEDVDHILSAIIAMLPIFFSECCGSFDSAAHFLPVFEYFFSIESCQIRDQSTEILSKLIPSMSPSILKDQIAPFVKRLASDSWSNFRTCSTSLCAILYAHTKDPQLLDIFQSLCQDTDPNVRRYAMTAMSFLIPSLPKEQTSEMLSRYVFMSSDDQDNVRIASAQTLPTWLQVSSAEEKSSCFLPMILKLAKDGGWRVRFSVADQMSRYVNYYDKSAVESHLLPVFIALLRDEESETRGRACASLYAVCSSISSSDILSVVFPCVLALSKDPVDHVRAQLAKYSTSLASLLGQPLAAQHLLSMYLSLLKDTDADVRLNIISTLDAVCQVVGVDVLSQSLMPTIVELAHHPQWRIRVQMIEYLPLLARQLHAQVFDDQLGQLVVSWFSDSIYSVRDSAIENLGLLCRIFGDAWATQSVIPRLIQLSGDSNHISRMTSMKSLKILSSVLKKDCISELTMRAKNIVVNDKIPNVRRCAVQALSAIIDSDMTEKHGIIPILNSATLDQDLDVAAAAKTAISHVK